MQGVIRGDDGAAVMVGVVGVVAAEAGAAHGAGLAGGGKVAAGEGGG